ncbi:50S ribosomal protein L25/general stress protein Ctc [Ketobacter sp. MCCC 1A13808]|uniref:50S ribosomal protein L25/general stress protein Ctc n=1 Tax=Ketobacter sp. MCCC 1A13808 TaxID=2602738 RepID=UPI000F1BAA80|nr:50S ribosomal protein L25/general stress protein Ctc [Ketobacter sp. MCCC 1A13808]MVF11282.1 50S ribosomal protein L25/general stress protein Ctc [Ketobacter sp. MCCC 1A13808]RLP53587.1 MAG: 50S ribosomal protein L25/general stress protein Ctc [Ketobacter sp.]
MSNEFTINAQSRGEAGKGSSRRLRRLENRIPAIVYGANKDPQQVSVEFKDMVKALENEAFYSHVLTLVVDGNSEQVVLKDLQRHPAKSIPVHADFQRVDTTHKLHMNIPLHFLNEDKCAGVKQSGGVIAHQMAEVEVTCLAKDLPEYIEIDVENLEMGSVIHLSDIKLPAGVEIRALQLGEDHDLPVVSVSAPRGGADEEAGDDEESATEE